MKERENLRKKERKKERKEGRKEDENGISLIKHMLDTLGCFSVKVKSFFLSYHLSPNYVHRRYRLMRVSEVFKNDVTLFLECRSILLFFES